MKRLQPPLWCSREKKHVHSGSEKTATGFTLSFLHFLLLLPLIMDHTCGVSAGENTRRTWKWERKLETVRLWKKGEAERRRRWSIQENNTITIPVTSQLSTPSTDPGFLQPHGADPRGLVGRHRSTTPFLTHHMLKEFSSALWDMTPVTPTTKFPNY